MGASRWLEEVVRPVTGERRRFVADSEEALDQQIAAWTSTEAGKRQLSTSSSELTSNRPKGAQL